MNRFAFVLFGLMGMTALSSQAQQVSTAQASPSPAGAAVQGGVRPAQIDRNGALTLVRTAIIALQQANQTNNYSVLFSMSAPGFQKSTPVEKLSQNFASLRDSKLDLSAVAVLEPQWLIAPQVDGSGNMRMAGYFPSAPAQVNFDLQFTPLDNRWRLLGLTVNVTPSSPMAPSAPAAAKARPAQSPEKAKPAKK